jgi:hypothetical protein
MAGKKRRKNNDESMSVKFTDEYGITHGPHPLDEGHIPPVDLHWPDESLNPISINLQVNVRLVPYVGYSVRFNNGPDLWAEEAGWRLNDKDKIDWDKTMEALKGKHAYIQDYIEDVLLEAIGNLVDESAGYDMPAHRVMAELGNSLDLEYIIKQQTATEKMMEQRERQFESEHPGVYPYPDFVREGIPKVEASWPQWKSYRAIKNMRSRLLRLKKWDYEFSADRVLKLAPHIIRFFLDHYEEAKIKWNRIRQMYDEKRTDLSNALLLPDGIEERARITEEWRRESTKEFGHTLQMFISEFGSYLVDDLMEAIKIEDGIKYKYSPSVIAIVEAGRLAFKRKGQHFAIGDAPQLFELRSECIRRDEEFKRFSK